jgi:hypothetical protein
MPNKPKTKLVSDELNKANETLLFKAKRYISEAPTSSAEKQRKKEMLIVFEKTINQLNGMIKHDCPPGKRPDEATGLCV